MCIIKKRNSSYAIFIIDYHYVCTCSQSVTTTNTGQQAAGRWIQFPNHSSITFNFISNILQRYVSADAAELMRRKGVDELAVVESVFSKQMPNDKWSEHFNSFAEIIKLSFLFYANKKIENCKKDLIVLWNHAISSSSNRSKWYFSLIALERQSFTCNAWAYLGNSSSSKCCCWKPREETNVL